MAQEHSLTLNAAGLIGESLTRAGAAGYWMASYGQGVGHFEDEIIRAHARLGEIVAAIQVHRAAAKAEAR